MYTMRECHLYIVNVYVIALAESKSERYYEQERGPGYVIFFTEKLWKYVTIQNKIKPNNAKHLYQNFNIKVTN